MRNISFALTTDQVRNRTKTVTRRLGWKDLKPGTWLQPVVKGMGLRKGERVEKIGVPIRVVSARRERLRLLENCDDYAWAEVNREGFGPNQLSVRYYSPGRFVEMFCEHNRCTSDTEVTRIEFEYIDFPYLEAEP